MFDFFTNYNSLVLLFFIIISFILGTLLFFLPTFIIYQDDYLDKISPYECGFNPFEESREPYDIQFYLVAVLFIIFDLEVSFLFPWSLFLVKSSFFSLFFVWLFLILLTLGFVYEWQKGALDWHRD